MSRPGGAAASIDAGRAGRRTGRRPVDWLAALGRPAGQDAVWAALRADRTPRTMLEIADAAKVHERTVRSCCTRWAAAGLVAIEGKPARCRLVHDTGAETPQVRRDGTPVLQGRGAENIWRTLKISKGGSAEDIARLASTAEVTVSVQYARSYLSVLHRAGYLTLAEGGNARHGRGVYRLVPARMTGPRAPQVQAIKALWDPNLGEVVWAQREGDE